MALHIDFCECGIRNAVWILLGGCCRRALNGDCYRNVKNRSVGFLKAIGEAQPGRQNHCLQQHSFPGFFSTKLKKTGR